MSEDTTGQTTDEGAEAAAAQSQETKPDTVDWKAKAREWERRAKENRAAADELTQIKEAQKTEAEKVADRLAKAEQTARDAEARALRREVALEHKLGKDDAALLDSVTDVDAMRRLAGRLAAGIESSTKKSIYVPREGTHTKATGSDERAFVRDLFGSGG